MTRRIFAISCDLSMPRTAVAFMKELALMPKPFRK